MKKIQIFTFIDGVTKKKDGTLSIKLGTQEMSPEETSMIFAFGNQQIWTAFSETEMTPNDIKLPDFTPEFKGEKSPSQRLKACVYRLWETTDKKKTSEEFYRDYMEKIIEHVKTKLD